MKAVVMTEPGAPEVLQVQEIPTPEVLGDNEILVRIKAAGVNPIDTKLRSRGTYFPDRLPTVLGCDGAGVVEATGAQVSRFKRGDAVYFFNGGIGGDQGNYAEFTRINERFAAQKPAALDFIQAAAAPLVLITAWESLHDKGNIKQGDEVLIHAGAGGVGHVAIQLARLAGARICTTVGSEPKAQFVKDCGAELVVNYKQHDFVQAVQDWSHGGGVNLALDTVGGKTFEKTFDAMRIYGDIVTLLQPEETVAWKQARIKNLRISLELMLSPMYLELEQERVRQTNILETCAKLFTNGELKIDVEKTFPLHEAAEAHRLIENGSMKGKAVLLLGNL